MVEYKKGKENKVVDAFSRLLDTDSAQPVSGVDQSLKSVVTQPEHENFFLISFPCPTWLAMLKDSYKTDKEYQQLISALTSGTSGPASFSLQNGILLYKEKVFLSAVSPLKSLILHHVHNNPLGGHSSYLKTLYRVKQDFFW